MKDCIDVRIYYEDTDCGGVVYYGKYLTYLEWARTEFFESRGINLVRLMNEGTYFVVIHVEMDYHRAPKYGDIISICSEIEEMSAASITFRHRIIMKDADKLLVSSKVKLACVGKNLKPQRLRKEIIDIL